MPLPALDFTLSLVPVAQAVDPSTFGPFTAWWKIAVLLLLLVVWLRTMQWFDKDAPAARLPRETINVGEWALLVIALASVFFVPTFAVAAGVFVALLLVGIGGYLVWRNTTVGLEDIPEQIGEFFKDLVTFKKGEKVKEKEKEAAIASGNVTLTDKRGDKHAPDSDDEEAVAGFETAHRMLVSPLERKAERIQIVQIAPRPATAETPEQQRYGTKMTVDGVDHAGSAFDAGSSVEAIAYLKALAGLDTSEHRKVQKGKFKGRTSDTHFELELITRGTRHGETATIEVNPGDRYKTKATALGMTSTQREKLDEFVRGGEGGLVLAVAPEGGGLDSIMYGLLQEHDAFTQHIVTAERSILREMEGIAQTAVGEKPDEHASQYSWLADQQPDVMVASKPAGKQAAHELLRLVAEEGKYVYVGIRASDVASGVAAWIKQVGDAKQAMRPVKMVLAGRVMRKLCDACKVPYEPSEQALAKMGVPKGKVRELFKARTEPMVDQRGNAVICPFCGGLGYRGRIGAFEMLVVDDDGRSKLAKDPSPSTVRNLLRNVRMSTLNDAAVRHVIAGKTDLSEVRRVLSNDAPARPAAKASA
ncbi:MAG: ATPase, T2SS/T4P/T4SS family [Planctomycetota bacterium]